VTRTITGFPKELTSIQYVPESNQIVVACANGQVRLADASNGNAVRNFDAAGDFLYTVKLTPDAQTVLSGGQSGTVRKWKLADGALVSELK
jgi:WD40 repeat protein